MIDILCLVFTYIRIIGYLLLAIIVLMHVYMDDTQSTHLLAATPFSCSYTAWSVFCFTYTQFPIIHGVSDNYTYICTNELEASWLVEACMIMVLGYQSESVGKHMFSHAFRLVTGSRVSCICTFI